jgi:hypothetical protein
MWSSGFSFGLRVKRHWCLRAGIVAVTLAALAAVWLSGLPPVGAWPLAIIAGLHGWWSLRTGSRVVDITVDGAGLIRTDAGGCSELQLTGKPWILPGVATGFRLADRDGRILPVILLRGQLSADTWRRLLVRIRRN